MVLEKKNVSTHYLHGRFVQPGKPGKVGMTEALMTPEMSPQTPYLLKVGLEGP